jgi:hypothetical protein
VKEGLSPLSSADESFLRLPQAAQDYISLGRTSHNPLLTPHQRLVAHTLQFQIYEEKIRDMPEVLDPILAYITQESLKKLKAGGINKQPRTKTR